ncbi:MAG: hypothetical protein M0P57_13925 [Syntrophales bacterium]|jgi:hypothetical protein|nr:hypothetical protein [Syntrophales bacterium]MDY0045481.1 hypothetical protein [Syntrophales bacterium]
MRGYLHISFFTSIIILFALDAHAGAIRLQTTLFTESANGGFLVGLEIKNTGDDPAHDVSATVEFTGSRQSVKLAPRLRAGEKVRTDMQFKASTTRGSFPLICETIYADDHHNIYSTFIVSQCANEAAQPEMEIFFHDKERNKEKSTPIVLVSSESSASEVFLKNNSGTEKSAALRLVAPRNLQVILEKERVTAGAGQVVRVPFSVSNLSFNPGSTCRIHAIAEYDEKGRHFTRISSRPLTIGERRNIFKTMNRGIFIAGLVMLIGFIFYNVTGKRS